MAHAPERGDISWLSFDPQAGLEQGGHRPEPAPSPKAYNGKTGLMLCCPMTTKVKGYRFEDSVAGAVPSAALTDRVKSLDWRARKAKQKGAAKKAEEAEELGNARALLEA